MVPIEISEANLASNGTLVEKGTCKRTANYLKDIYKYVTKSCESAVLNYCLHLWPKKNHHN